MNILMTVEELAKYLKIKPDTIYKKVRKGELPAVKLGKLLRFPKELIDQWILEQAQKTAKARKIISDTVVDVVDEVNKTARVAQAARKVISDDMSEIIEDFKNATLANKSDTLKKGLQGLWSDLNREMTRGTSTASVVRRKKATKAKVSKASVGKTPKTPKKTAKNTSKAPKVVKKNTNNQSRPAGAV